MQEQPQGIGIKGARPGLMIGALAAIPLLMGPTCEPRLPIGSDDAGPTEDASAMADAGTAPDAARPDPDGGSPDPDAGLPIDSGAGGGADFTDAAQVCGMLNSCLDGQVWLSVCINMLQLAPTPEVYRALSMGRAAVILRGDWTTVPPGDESGYLPVRDAPFSIPSMLAEPSFRACVRSATTCDDVHACMNGGGPMVPCTPGAGTTSCDGDTVRACVYTGYDLEGFPPDKVGRDGRALSFDCRTQGNSCVRGHDLDSRTYGCGPAACDSETFVERCEGSVAVSCELGVIDREPCTGCFIRDGRAACAGDGEPCDEASFPSHCEGSDLVGCAEGRVMRSPCGAVDDMSCYTYEGYSYCGYGDECSIADGSECVPDGIRTCVLGRHATVDCGALGFDHCTRGLLFDAYCE